MYLKSINILHTEEPEPPTSVTIETSGSRSVKLSWDIPYDGFSPITSYIIDYKSEHQIWDVTSQNVTVTGNVTEAVIGQLLPAVTYQVRVRAKNAVGVSEPSKIIQVYTSEEGNLFLKGLSQFDKSPSLI